MLTQYRVEARHCTRRHSLLHARCTSTARGAHEVTRAPPCTTSGPSRAHFTSRTLARGSWVWQHCAGGCSCRHGRCRWCRDGRHGYRRGRRRPCRRCCGVHRGRGWCGPPPSPTSLQPPSPAARELATHAGAPTAPIPTPRPSADGQDGRPAPPTYHSSLFPLPLALAIASLPLLLVWAWVPPRCAAERRLARLPRESRAASAPAPAAVAACRLCRRGWLARQQRP